MKNLRVATAVSIMAFVSLTAMSCNEGKKGQRSEVLHAEESTSGNNGEMAMNTSQTSDAEQVVADYMMVKEALVATSKDEAAKAGNKLERTLNGFDMSSYTSEQQSELKDIIADAKEHAEHIGKSEMDHQREHFKILSKDITDMVAITGTETTLYQQFCPMYDGGSAWLSMSKDVKNPYYGSKMMSCGKVQKEIN
jgi:hypothetical protein